MLATMLGIAILIVGMASFGIYYGVHQYQNFKQKEKFLQGLKLTENDTQGIFDMISKMQITMQELNKVNIMDPHFYL